MAIPEERREEILTRVRNGESRNSICKSMKASPKTVTAVVAEAGLTFEREATKAATAAAVADAKARRAALGLAMLGDLEDARENLGGAETARDFLARAQGFDAITRAYVNLQRLEPDDGGLNQARGMVGMLLGAIASSVDGVARLNSTEPREVEA